MNYKFNTETDYKISLQKSDDQGDIIKIKISIDFENKITPKPVVIRWTHPCKNVFSQWNPQLWSVRVLNPNWMPIKNCSRSAEGTPLQMHLSRDGINEITVSVSDPLTPMEIATGIIEETAEISYKLTLFTKLVSPMDKYETILTIDTRKLPYEEVLADTSRLWYVEEYVPDEAKEPMYSTWYSYHQNLDRHELIAELKAAKQLGMETVIVDDGWQTRDGQRGYAHCGDWEPERPAGTPGYDLPANIGLLVLGWIYGEGDFGKSICIAAGCCEDGDCTAATLGAIMGIINGADALPEKWIKPIGDEIKTISLNLAMETMGIISVPKTVTELTDGVCNIMPVFLSGFYDVMNGTITMNNTNDLICRDKYRATFVTENFKDIFTGDAPTVTYENMFLKMLVHCKNGINVNEDQALRFELEALNLIPCQQWLNVRIFMPSEWECSAGREFAINLDQPHAGFGKEKVYLEITPHNITSSRTDIVFEISSVGKLGKMYIPHSLFRAPQEFRVINDKA